jgi:hypothetical protein
MLVQRTLANPHPWAVLLTFAALITAMMLVLILASMLRAYRMHREQRTQRAYDRYRYTVGERRK